MSNDEPVQSVDTEKPQRNFEAQSAFASTLLADVEKTHPSQVAAQGKRSGNLYKTAIDTTPVEVGVDAVYAAKATIMNEALLDIGMGKYQWFLFICTGVGWFLDQVSYHEMRSWEERKKKL